MNEDKKQCLYPRSSVVFVVKFSSLDVSKRRLGPSVRKCSRREYANDPDDYDKDSQDVEDLFEFAIHGNVSVYQPHQKTDDHQRDEKGNHVCSPSPWLKKSVFG
jgi:hypothetical protein